VLAAAGAVAALWLVRERDIERESVLPEEEQDDGTHLEHEPAREPQAAVA
jgi:hypothetical protein